jgi:hypothetical protein
MGQSAHAIRAGAVPQRGLPPRHARNDALLADPAGRISSTPSRRPAERHHGRGPPTPPVASTFGQHTYRTSYYRSIRGIFLTEGFQATIRLPKVPPPRPLPGGQTFIVCSCSGWLNASRNPTVVHREPKWAHGLVRWKETGVFSSGGEEVAIWPRYDLGFLDIYGLTH